MFLLQHVTENTRTRLGNSPSLLDLIVTNEDNLIDQMSYGAPVGKSNHVSLTFNYTTKIEHSDMIKLNYWNGKYGEINAELGKINWSNLLQDKDLDSGWRRRKTSCWISQKSTYQYGRKKEKE